MTHSPIDPAEKADGLYRKEQIEAADLQAAIRVATCRAFETMAADLAEGRLKPDRCIVIQNDRGETIHIVRFRDLIDHADTQSN